MCSYVPENRTELVTPRPMTHAKEQEASKVSQPYLNEHTTERGSFYFLTLKLFWDLSFFWLLFLVKSFIWRF